MPNELLYHFLWTDPCLMEGVLVSDLFLLSFITEIPVLHANSVDPDQMPHSVASDLELLFAKSSFLGCQANSKWVNKNL